VETLTAGRPWPENGPKSHRTRRITIIIRRAGTRTRRRIRRRRRGGAGRRKKQDDEEQENGKEWISYSRQLTLLRSLCRVGVKKIYLSK